MLLLGNSPGTEGTSAFWEKSEAPLPFPQHVCNFIHPKQLSPFPERLEPPFPEEEVLSGYEEDVSFILDCFTTWVKADPNDMCSMFERPSRNIVKHLLEGTTHLLKSITSTAACQNRSSVQKSLSIYNWNPGPRRRKEGATEKQVAGK